MKFSLDVELPVLNKVFFCLPLRGGLMVWAFLHLLFSISLAIWSMINFGDNVGYYNYAYSSYHINIHQYYTYRPSLTVMVLIFLVMMTLYILQCVAMAYLLTGAKRNNGTHLEVCYQFLRIKLKLFAVVWIIAMICLLAVHDTWIWFNYHTDTWTGLTLCDNPLIGVLVWALQFYQLLLVRSQIENLGHRTELRSLCRRLRNREQLNQDNFAQNITQNFGDEKKLYI